MHKKLRNLKSSNPKDYWAILNSERNNQFAKIATETLLVHLKNLNTSKYENKNPTKAAVGNRNHKNGDPNILKQYPFNAPFTEEILKLTLKLKNGKASGLDAIINEFIKHSPPQMISLLTSYINIVLSGGIVNSDRYVGVLLYPFTKTMRTQMTQTIIAESLS